MTFSNSNEVKNHPTNQTKKQVNDVEKENEDDEPEILTSRINSMPRWNK